MYLDSIIFVLFYIYLIVTQVSGELSNAGQPMRRFTQTFVLAVQAPKTYYVHNDIFRYQDLMFNDEDEADASGGDGGESGEREVEEIGRTEPEEDEHQSNQVPPLSAPAQAAEQQAQPALIPAQQQPPLQQQQPMAYYAAPPQPHVNTDVSFLKIKYCLDFIILQNIHVCIINRL